MTEKEQSTVVDPSDTVQKISLIVPIARASPGFGKQSGAFPVPTTVGCVYDGNTVMPETVKS